MIWRKSTQLQVDFTSDQMITCSIKIFNSDVDFCCSFVYASNFVADRTKLWRDIKDQHDQALLRGKLWLLMRDYNETLALDEHSNSDVFPHITPGMCDFQEVVRYCSFSDLKTHGPTFTWCNKREEGLVFKKLDRVLHNAVWNQVFPQSYCVMEAGVAQTISGEE